MTHLDDYELRESLEHGTRKERCDAAVALGDAGKDYPMTMTLGALARAVWQDESRAVRRAAAESLYRLGDAGFEMLRRMLIEDSVKMRLMIESFSRMGDAYYYHFQELEECDKRARKSIIEALGNFKDKRAVRAMIDVLEKEDAVGRGKMYKEWNSQSNLHWSYVSEHLGRIADADIDTLLDALDNGCKVTRMCVADALGAIENADERVVSALSEVSKAGEEDDDWSRRISHNASESLRKLRVGEEVQLLDESVIPTLKEELKRDIEAMEAEEYYDIGWNCARALCKFGYAGLDAIVDAVRPHVKDRGSFDELIEMAREEHPDDGFYGDDPSALRLCDLYEKLQNEPVIIPILLYLMKHDSSSYCSPSDVSAVAAQMIYLLGDQDIYLLFDLLEDNDIRVRKAAARLGSQYPEYLEETNDLYFEVDLECNETDPLLIALKDDPYVRGDIAEMFSKLIISGFPDIGYVIDDFIYLIEDPNPDVRGAATEAFYRLGLSIQGELPDQELERIIKMLLDMSEDENVHDALDRVQEDRQWYEWYAYSDCKPKIVTHTVIEMLMKNRNVALLHGLGENIAALALTKLCQEAWSTIIQALYNKNRHAIYALNNFCMNVTPDSTTIETLIETLNNDEVESIDRKISAIVLEQIHHAHSRRIDEIRRNSDRISSALSELAVDVDVDNTERALDELFWEYHKYKEGEPDE